MTIKSTTQMTKSELLETIRKKDIIIAQLNDRIDDLEKLAITSQAIPLDADSSRLLTLMNQRIRALEQQLGDRNAN
jgi:hypothetical protein